MVQVSNHTFKMEQRLPDPNRFIARQVALGRLEVQAERPGRSNKKSRKLARRVLRYLEQVLAGVPEPRADMFSGVGL